MSDIHHNPAEQRFEIILDGHVAELTYDLAGDRISFTHTGVPDPFRGKGIGAALVKAGLDYAAEHHFRVVPLCSFVAAYIDRHPQYRGLLA